MTSRAPLSTAGESSSARSDGAQKRARCVTVHMLGGHTRRIGDGPPFPIVCNPSGTAHRNRVAVWWRHVTCRACLEQRAGGGRARPLVRLALLALLALAAPARAAESCPVGEIEPSYVLRWTVPASGAECECNTCENGWCTLLACADPCRAPRERAHLSLDQAISHANSLAMVCTEEIQREVDENSSSTWNTAHVCRPGDVQDVTIVKTYSVEIPLKRTAETETVEREKSVRFEVAP